MSSVETPARTSYRAVGTASQLLQGRLAFLAVTPGIAIVSGAQLLYVLETRRGRRRAGARRGGGRRA